eukprot:SAG31_NODE_4142_length_3537_cov_15.892088_3_plen_140_part_00
MCIFTADLICRIIFRNSARVTSALELVQVAGATMDELLQFSDEEILELAKEHRVGVLHRKRILAEIAEITAQLQEEDSDPHAGNRQNFHTPLTKVAVVCPDGAGPGVTIEVPVQVHCTASGIRSLSYTKDLFGCRWVTY